VVSERGKWGKWQVLKVAVAPVMYAKENGCGWAILNNADIHTYAKISMYCHVA